MQEVQVLPLMRSTHASKWLLDIQYQFQEKKSKASLIVQCNTPHMIANVCTGKMLISKEASYLN